jgi:hypothetical protein
MSEDRPSVFALILVSVRGRMAMRLHAARFGLAFEIIYGLFFLLLGLAAAQYGWGVESMKATRELFPGFEPTIVGAAIGGIWGLVLGFVFFGLAARLYNAMLKPY